MPAEPIVRIQDLTVRYGGLTAVAGVDLCFDQGASGLLGRNGAGKTSILRALLGLVRPARGTLQVLGVDAASDPLFVRAHVGYMPEGSRLFPGATGFEAVVHAGRLAGLARRVARRRAHEMLYFAGLGEARYRNADGYSTGMVQRVKLAMALVHDPPLLFLDEPTNGLDPAGRREMLACVAELGRRHDKTVILSSHILGDVEEVCSGAVLVHEGRVVARGLLGDLTASAEKVWELLVRGEETPLSSALAEAGFSLHSCRRKGAFHLLRLGHASGQGTRGIFSAVARSGGQVRSLLEVRRSLEEVFGEVVGEQG